MKEILEEILTGFINNREKDYYNKYEIDRSFTNANGKEEFSISIFHHSMDKQIIKDLKDRLSPSFTCELEDMCACHDTLIVGFQVITK